MMEQDFEYAFWIWGNKLNGVLSMLSHLAEYALSDDEREAIKIELKGTNDELNFWGQYDLHGEKYLIKLKLAYDDAEGTDLIFLKINTSSELKEKLELLNTFQEMFLELEEKYK